METCCVFRDCFMHELARGCKVGRLGQKCINAPTIPEVCNGDQRSSSSIAISHVASHDIACVDLIVSACGLIKRSSAKSDVCKGSKRSKLTLPVIVDQPDTSRALESRNCAMLIAPYRSNFGSELISGLGDKKTFMASEYGTSGVDCLAASCLCAHRAEEKAVQQSSGQGRSCFISRWESDRGIEKSWYHSASI